MSPHGFPHAPQWSRFDVKSAQSAPQIAFPAGHEQALPWHVWPLEQAVVQLPQ
jgi:hypothetical protein